MDYTKAILCLALAMFLLGISLIGLRTAGYKAIFLFGHSMEPALSQGSLLISQFTSPQDIRVGDIISLPNPRDGSNIVHRVVVLEHKEQHIVAQTMGDNNLVVDPELLTLDRFTTRMVVVVPHGTWYFMGSLGVMMLVLCWCIFRYHRAMSKIPLASGVSSSLYKRV